MSIRPILFLGCALVSLNAWAGNISLQLPGAAEMHLDQAITLKGAIHTDGSVSGVLNLSAVVPPSVQIPNDAKFKISPSSVTLKAGTPADVPFMLMVVTTPSSHSFSGLQISVGAESPDHVTSISQNISLTVDPIYEIDLTGGPAPEGWSSPMTLTMPKHDPAVTIRFVNKDTKSTHTIHGEGAIPHQDTDNPMAAATADHDGGVYEITVPTGDPVMGYYRCHDHEDDSMLRTISFNN